MDSLKELINKITEFPELYIGKPSVELLYAFLGGFLYQNDSADDHCLDGFNEFVLQKYRLRTDHNWANVIRFFPIQSKKHFIHSLNCLRNFLKAVDKICLNNRRILPSPFLKQESHKGDKRTVRKTGDGSLS